LNKEPYVEPEIKTELLGPVALCNNFGSPDVIPGQSGPGILGGSGGGGGSGGYGGIGDYGGSSGYGGSGGHGDSGSG
jgi:hypothetical protein